MPGSPGAIAIVWNHPDAAGPEGEGNALAVGSGVDPVPRYDPWDGDRLNSNFWYPGNVDSQIRSVSLFAPTTGSTTLILYTTVTLDPLVIANPGIEWNNLDGNFLLLDNRTGNRLDINLWDFFLDPFGFTWDRWPSTIIVAHSAPSILEKRFSAAASLTPIWVQTIDPQLQNANGGVVQKVVRDGPPQWSWVAFPKVFPTFPDPLKLNPHQNY